MAEHASRIKGRLTSLRRATHEDVDLLVTWHGDPDVARYWDDQTFTVDEVAERLARDDVGAWIVETLDQRPIGYVQTHPEGMDMFLIPSARGRGLGPDAARAMARHLLESGTHRHVFVDPYEWNEGAIRAWIRAGFVEVSRGHPPDEDHASPWVLMEYREHNPDARGARPTHLGSGPSQSKTTIVRPGVDHG